MTPMDAATSGALVIERADLGTLVATGTERLSWLNGILTCDTAIVGPGRGAWGLVLNKQGKIQSETYVVGAEEAAYLSVPSGIAPELMQYLNRFLIMEDAELHDGSAAFTWLTLHGPRAVACAAQAAASGAYGAVDWTGLGGAALVVRREHSEAVLKQLGQSEGVVVGSATAWERLRVERAVPSFGVDYATSDNPHEASLDRRAISWSKGCYLGQEVVCMQDMRGKVKRRVVPLLVESASVAPGASISASGHSEAVGEVTSSVVVDGRTLALAKVKTSHVESGAELSIAGARAMIVAPSG